MTGLRDDIRSAYCNVCAPPPVRCNRFATSVPIDSGAHSRNFFSAGSCRCALDVMLLCAAWWTHRMARRTDTVLAHHSNARVECGVIWIERPGYWARRWATKFDSL